jgi:thioredoxin reductase
MSVDQTDVLIVGAGPAGLSAGIALKRLGVKNVIVVDREDMAGGTPRLCHHTGFGLRDLRWAYSGPDYARHYAGLAQSAGLEIRTSTTVTGWQGESTVATTSPRGLGSIQARAILLATGCRERPRSARLVPGRRPQGVYTTGSLQRFVYQHHLPVGKRAVIVGAELVSLSALMTLGHAHVSTVAMVTEHPSHQIYFPYLAAKWLYADLMARVPVLSGARVVNLLGGERLEGVEIAHAATGQQETLACDAVVFTGDWIPEHELARSGGVALDAGTKGPQVDAGFHTPTRGVFAAGNLLRGAETADACALEGARAARHINAFLMSGQWPAQGLMVAVESPIDWIYPNVVNTAAAAAEPGGFHFRVKTFCRDMRLTVDQGRKEVFTQSYRSLAPNDTVRLDGRWLGAIDPAGGPLRMVLESDR